MCKGALRIVDAQRGITWSSAERPRAAAFRSTSLSSKRAQEIRLRCRPRRNCVDLPRASSGQCRWIMPPVRSIHMQGGMRPPHRCGDEIWACAKERIARPRPHVGSGSSCSAIIRHVSLLALGQIAPDNQHGILDPDGKAIAAFKLATATTAPAPRDACRPLRRVVGSSSSSKRRQHLG